MSPSLRTATGRVPTSSPSETRVELCAPLPAPRRALGLRRGDRAGGPRKQALRLRRPVSTEAGMQKGACRWGRPRLHRPGAPPPAPPPPPRQVAAAGSPDRV